MKAQNELSVSQKQALTGGGEITLHSHASAAGDMTKAVYDPNDDGVIAKAQLDAALANTSGTNTGDQTLAGLGGIAHSLATAINDFLVASGAGTFVKKTLAETKTILDWAGDISTHAALTTGIHGVGVSTVASVANITTHAALQTGVHGISITAGKTLTVSNSLTLTATDGSTLAIGTGGTLGTGAYATIALYATLASPTFTGTVTIPTPFTLGIVSVTATGTELNYVVGVSSAIQTQINGKSPTAGNASLVTVGTITSGVWNATDIPVSAGGTGLSAITALSIWVANSANTIAEVTPGAGNSIRINAGGTAWEAFTPATGTVTSVSVVSANGFAGTVATATTTPAITISTSITGILLGDGTAVTGLASSGTGNVVRVAGATLTTPTLGIASATSLATSAAIPLLLTNGQLVNIALTAQTIGTTTLTIPDFASVVDEFVFKTKAVTMSNKTFVAPALGAATGTSLQLSGLTASEILGTDASKNLVSLAVATYPSLTELSYVKGVTSAIQTQLGLKSPLASPTFTGTVTVPTPFTIGAVSMTATGTELNYVAGVTSAIQTQFGLKAPLASPTFTGTVTIPTPYTIGAVSMTSTGIQLNYLNAATGTTGTTSTNIVFSESPTFTGTVALPIVTTTGAITLPNNVDLNCTTTTPTVVSFVKMTTGNQFTVSGATGIINFFGFAGATARVISQVATGGATLRNSPTFALTAAYWTGAASVYWAANFLHTMDATTPKSTLGLTINAVAAQSWENNNGTISVYLPSLTSNGFVKTSGGTGVLSVDTTSVPPIIARKAADETVSNSTTLQDDDALLFAVGANEVWEVNVILRVTTTAVADLKIDFTLPTGGAFSYKHTRTPESIANQNAGTPTTILSGAAMTAALVFYYGIYIGGANAGNVQLQWAQNTAEVSDSKILANSCIIAHKLA